MEQPVDKPSFDERAALEELERLRRNIESYRARRRELGEEFEAFIRGFRATREEWDRSAARLEPQEAPAPDAGASPPQQAVAAPASSPAVDSLVEEQTVTTDAPATPDSLTARSIEPPMPPAFDDIVSPRPAPTTADVAAAFDEQAPTPLFADDAPRKPISNRTLAVAAAAVILLVAAVFLTKWSSSPTPAEPEAPAAVAPAVASPEPQAAAPPPAPVSSGTELVTTGRAWVRLTVDGARLFERELAAGTRVPIDAKQSIVIRTGDAGAVRLTIRGVEQPPLGRAGDVVTRAFKVPPPR